MLCGVAAAEEPNLRLDINSQPLGAALNEFARQSGLQVFLTAEDGSGVVARKVSGTFTPQGALDALLSGTGLVYEFLNDRTVAVRAGSRSSASTSTGTVPSKIADEELRLADSA